MCPPGRIGMACRTGLQLFTDTTTVLNIGIIIGLLLPQLRQDICPVRKVPRQHIAAGLIGGALMGYGAAFACCNIGAYFSGIASASLHGWVGLVRSLELGLV